jgi:hypothetical protein
LLVLDGSGGSVPGCLGGGGLLGEPREETVGEHFGLLVRVGVVRRVGEEDRNEWDGKMKRGCMLWKSRKRFGEMRNFYSFQFFCTIALLYQEKRPRITLRNPGWTTSGMSEGVVMRRGGGTGASTCYWMCLFHCTKPCHVDTCESGFNCII